MVDGAVLVGTGVVINGDGGLVGRGFINVVDGNAKALAVGIPRAVGYVYIDAV